MLTIEYVYRVMSRLYELGIEWCLGPETLCRVIRNEDVPHLDIAVSHVDLEQVHKNMKTLLELNIKKIFIVPYGGFSRRCVYVRALPCISVDDAVLSSLLDENREYLDTVRFLIEHSRDNLDVTYLRIMCRRLGICDELCRRLGLCL